MSDSVREHILGWVLKVTCPQCKAAPGQPCDQRPNGWGYRRTGPHALRWDKGNALRLKEEARIRRELDALL